MLSLLVVWWFGDKRKHKAWQTVNEGVIHREMGPRQLLTFTIVLKVSNWSIFSSHAYKYAKYAKTKLHNNNNCAEFSSAVLCAELRAQCVFDRRSSSYCLMLDPSSVCSCLDYWMCEWSVHGPGKIPKTDRKKRKTGQSAFFPRPFSWGWDSAFRVTLLNFMCIVFFLRFSDISMVFCHIAH